MSSFCSVERKTRLAALSHLELVLLYRAENETRTRDPDLGKVVLYQLSYFRIIRGQGQIRTAEAVRQQIYSLPVLTTYLPTQSTDLRQKE